MRRVLCTSGKRFSGKDTFAALLQQAAAARGVTLATYAFAAQCKELFVRSERARGVEVDLERLTRDRAYKEAWRPQLTAFTVASLDADPQIFVRDVARAIEADPRPPLITDLRLRLELDFLRPRFALTVLRLQRSDEARARSGWVFDQDKDLHHTETELDDPSLWSEVIANDGTPVELAAAAERVLSAFLS